MRIGRLKPHYGSAALGFSSALLLTAIAALLRARVAPQSESFPFLFCYPVILAVSFCWGLAPGAAAVVFSALAVPGLTPALRPSMLNWLSLAVFGSLTVAMGVALRMFRESAVETARAIVRFHMVTENMSDWVFLLNASGSIEYANRAALHGVGKPAEQVIGGPFASLVIPEDRQAADELIQAALAGSVPPKECRIHSSGGEAIPAELSCTAITANKETVIHVAGRDLRERRETERRLREAKQWEALGTLAGGIAHDFNNLLTAMMGNASLARELLPATHETAGLLDNVLATGARSANLIELMLAAAGYRRNFVSPIEPKLLLESAIAKLQTRGPARISARAGGGVFHGEHASVERLLMCLLENAAESYGEPGGEVSAEIGVAEYAGTEPCDFEEGQCAGECLRIVVEDRGPGMDAATMERAFNPFFTTKFTGRGLGLAAVRGLVRAYSGKLCMRSRPGQGTRVEVWLPNPPNGKAG